MYSTDEIHTISPINFFSLLDNDNFVYGFHIETIYKYIESCDKLYINGNNDSFTYENYINYKNNYIFIPVFIEQKDYNDLKSNSNFGLK